MRAYFAAIELIRIRLQQPLGAGRGECSRIRERDREPRAVAAGLEATDSTRPGHPSHASKIARIVKQQDGNVVVETSGAGKLPLAEFEGIDQELIKAVAAKLEPPKQPLAQTTTQPPPPPPQENAFDAWKKDPAVIKKDPAPPPKKKKQP